MTGVAVSEGTHHPPHPDTSAACAALWQMDAHITTHAMTHPTSIFAPHPTLATCPADITCMTISGTGAALIPATPISLHRKHSQRKPSHVQDLQLPINPTIPKLSPSRIPLQIQTATLIL